MDPAVSRIAAVDERAREQVNKAREYASAVFASRAEEEEESVRSVRENARKRTEDAVAAKRAETDEKIAAARAEADSRIRSVNVTEEKYGDAVAAIIAGEITGGML